MAKERYNEIFGRNLRAYRESLGQTRLVFVRQYDGFASTLASYETGNKGPSLKRFIHICNSLRVSPNFLLDGLVPVRTELLEIQALHETMERLRGAERQKVQSVQSTFIRCALETPPGMREANLGTRLHLLRLDAGLEIEELAERCMIAKPTLQGCESGQYDPSVPVVLRMCEVFEVSPEYLLVPMLTHLSYADERLAYLRPRQIKALLDITRALVG